MICMECEVDQSTHNDPRSPPLDIEYCLCSSCYEMAADEEIETLQYQIDMLLDTIPTKAASSPLKEE